MKMRPKFLLFFSLFFCFGMAPLSAASNEKKQDEPSLQKTWQNMWGSLYNIADRSIRYATDWIKQNPGKTAAGVLVANSAVRNIPTVVQPIINTGENIVSEVHQKVKVAKPFMYGSFFSALTGWMLSKYNVISFKKSTPLLLIPFCSFFKTLDDQTDETTLKVTKPSITSSTSAGEALKEKCENMLTEKEKKSLQKFFEEKNKNHLLIYGKPATDDDQNELCREIEATIQAYGSPTLEIKNPNAVFSLYGTDLLKKIKQQLTKKTVLVMYDASPDVIGAAKKFAQENSVRLIAKPKSENGAKIDNAIKQDFIVLKKRLPLPQDIQRICENVAGKTVPQNFTEGLKGFSRNEVESLTKKFVEKHTKHDLPIDPEGPATEHIACTVLHKALKRKTLESTSNKNEIAKNVPYIGNDDAKEYFEKPVQRANKELMAFRDQLKKLEDACPWLIKKDIVKKSYEGDLAQELKKLNDSEKNAHVSLNQKSYANGLSTNTLEYNIKKLLEDADAADPRPHYSKQKPFLKKAAGQIKGLAHGGIGVLGKMSAICDPFSWPSMLITKDDHLPANAKQIYNRIAWAFAPYYKSKKIAQTVAYQATKVSGEQDTNTLVDTILKSIYTYAEKKKQEAICEDPTKRSPEEIEKLKASVNFDKIFIDPKLIKKALGEKTPNNLPPAINAMIDIPWKLSEKKKINEKKKQAKNDSKSMLSLKQSNLNNVTLDKGHNRSNSLLGEFYTQGKKKPKDLLAEEKRNSCEPLN